METNTKRLNQLIKFIDIALIAIVLSMLYAFFYAVKDAENIIKVTKDITERGGPANIKMVLDTIGYLNILKIVVSKLFYGILLLYIRKVVRSIINGELFKEELAFKMRKIALFSLYFAAFLMFFNLMYMLAALNKHHSLAFRNAIMFTTNIFENYVITALIIFGMAEVFVSGKKIREEQDLTI